MNFLRPHHRPDPIALQRQYRSTAASLASADDFDGIEMPDESPEVWFCVQCNAGNTGAKCKRCGAETTVLAMRKQVQR